MYECMICCQNISTLAPAALPNTEPVATTPTALQAFPRLVWSALMYKREAALGILPHTRTFPCTFSNLRVEGMSQMLLLPDER
jgi:hypothetical protein